MGTELFNQAKPILEKNRTTWIRSIFRWWIGERLLNEQTHSRH